MEWGRASIAEPGFARQVGKDSFLAADSFRMGSARGSGESAGVGLVRPWSGAVLERGGSRLRGIGRSWERRVWKSGGLRAAWKAISCAEWGQLCDWVENFAVR